jgi:hypothetical protein
VVQGDARAPASLAWLWLPPVALGLWPNPLTLGLLICWMGWRGLCGN